MPEIAAKKNKSINILQFCNLEIKEDTLDNIFGSHEAAHMLQAKYKSIPKKLIPIDEINK